MSYQKDQEPNFEKCFGNENNDASYMSDSSDRASVISSASLSSLSRKCQIQLNSDLSINTSIWGINDSTDSANFSKNSELSESSSSTTGTHKYRKVTSSSSCSSSTKNRIDDDDDSSAPLLHVHKVLRKKNCNSSSPEKKNVRVDAVSSSATTGENDYSSSSSHILCEHRKKDTGQFASTTLKENTSLYSVSDIREQHETSETSLEDAQNRGRERAEKERNNGASFLSAHPKPIAVLSSPTELNISSTNNLYSNAIGVNPSTTDTMGEACKSFTSFLPLHKKDKGYERIKNSVGNFSGTRAGSVNCLQTNQSGQVSANLTHLNEMTGNSANKQISSSSSARFDNNQTLNGLPVKNAHATNIRTPPLPGSSSSPPVAREMATDSLSSAIESVIYRDYSHITPEAAHAEMVRDNTSRTLCRKDPPFPQKLHQILSHPDCKQWIAWLPHGRAWKILDQASFEDKVLPKYFQHSKLNSFMRQVSNWGFKRVHSGPDKNSYYHEFFLRGLPHISMKMKRQRPGKSKEKSLLAMFRVAPDLYQVSQEHPLPDENGVFPPAIGTQRASNSSSSNIAPTPFNGNSQHIATISVNSSSSTNVATPLKNTLSAATCAPYPAQSSQGIIAQRCTSGVLDNNNSVFHGSSTDANTNPRNIGIGQALFGNGTREPAINLEIHSGNNLPQRFQINQHIRNSTGATIRGTNAIQPTLP